MCNSREDRSSGCFNLFIPLSVSPEKPTVGGQRERGGLGLLQGASTPLRKHT